MTKINLQQYDLLHLSEDEMDSIETINRTSIQRKEIKSQWNKEEDGINVNKGKSIEMFRKW